MSYNPATHYAIPKGAVLVLPAIALIAVAGVVYTMQGQINRANQDIATLNQSIDYHSEIGDSWREYASVQEERAAAWRCFEKLHTNYSDQRQFLKQWADLDDPDRPFPVYDASELRKARSYKNELARLSWQFCRGI